EVALSRHGAGVSDLVAPATKLRVQILNVAKRARREKRRPKVLNLSFDSSFLISARWSAGAWGEVVVPAELEQSRVKADRITAPLQDRAFQIVVQDVARGALKKSKCLHVAAQEALQGLVEGEERVDCPRPGEHHHEAGKRSLRFTGADGAEASPVGLRLLAGQNAQTQIRCLGPGRADLRHQTPKPYDRSVVAPAAQHLVKPRRPQPRVALQGLAHERQVRIEPPRPYPGGARLQPLDLDREPYGVWVHAERLCDRPHLP